MVQQALAFVMFITTVLGVIIVAAVFAALPTMIYWNYVMPSIFGLMKINFHQAISLNVLVTILFKDFYFDFFKENKASK